MGINYLIQAANEILGKNYLAERWLDKNSKLFKEVASIEEAREEFKRVLKLHPFKI